MGWDVDWRSWLFGVEVGELITGCRYVEIRLGPISFMWT